jgi:hypothetical protein
MNWDQIEIKWAEMTSRLQADVAKGLAGPSVIVPAQQSQSAVAEVGPTESDREATPEVQAN